MAKKYNNNWGARKLIVNFNQKQWRQDLAAYINEHLYWNGKVRVTRSRVTKRNSSIYLKGRKQFYVYNNIGDEVIVTYDNENKVIDTTHRELIENYLKGRNI